MLNDKNSARKPSREKSTTLAFFMCSMLTDLLTYFCYIEKFLFIKNMLTDLLTWNTWKTPISVTYQCIFSRFSLLLTTVDSLKKPKGSVREFSSGNERAPTNKHANWEIDSAFDPFLFRLLSKAPLALFWSRTIFFWARSLNQVGGWFLRWEEKTNSSYAMSFEELRHSFRAKLYLKLYNSIVSVYWLLLVQICFLDYFIFCI